MVVLTVDGKGVVRHRDDLRAATRKAAEQRRQKKEQRSRLFTRLKKGEQKHAKRMATVAAVSAVAPFVRSPEEFLRSVMPPPPSTPRLRRVRESFRAFAEPRRPPTKKSRTRSMCSNTHCGCALLVERGDEAVRQHVGLYAVPGLVDSDQDAAVRRDPAEVDTLVSQPRAERRQIGCGDPQPKEIGPPRHPVDGEGVMPREPPDERL